MGSMGVIPCEDMESWQELEDKVHGEMIKDNVIQKRWSYPVNHPDGKRYGFLTKPRMIKYLTEAQKIEKVELDASWSSDKGEL